MLSKSEICSKNYYKISGTSVSGSDNVYIGYGTEAESTLRDGPYLELSKMSQMDWIDLHSSPLQGLLNSGRASFATCHSMELSLDWLFSSRRQSRFTTKDLMLPAQLNGVLQAANVQALPLVL